MSARKPFVAAISGIKNSGKTTFLEHLVPVLRARGLRVAVIKHDGHDFTPVSYTHLTLPTNSRV